jgi:hypothetical protein
MNRQQKPKDASWSHAWIIAVTSLIIGCLILAAVELHGLNQMVNEANEAAECSAVDSPTCFSGNACQPGSLEEMCQSRSWPGEEPPWPLDQQSCGSQACVYRQLPDGSCCPTDECYAPDPSKICVSGQCVTANYTLCRGFCLNDAMCNSSYAVPVLPNVEALEAVCVNGACLTIAGSFAPFASCEDLLNLTTLKQRQVAACLETYRYQYDIGDFTYMDTCFFSYICSRGIAFASKKRTWDNSIAAVNETVPQLHLPGRFISENDYKEATVKVYAHMARLQHVMQ